MATFIDFECSEGNDSDETVVVGEDGYDVPDIPIPKQIRKKKRARIESSSEDNGEKVTEHAPQPSMSYSEDANDGFQTPAECEY